MVVELCSWPCPGMFSGVEVGQPGVRLGTSGQDA